MVSILSERRAFRPYGLAGGEDGHRGMNLLRFAADSRTISLGGKNTISVLPGDRLLILSLVMLTALSLVVATEAHAFCQLFCIHGEAMVSEICSGTTGR